MKMNGKLRFNSTIRPIFYDVEGYETDWAKFGCKNRHPGNRRDSEFWITTCYRRQQKNVIWEAMIWCSFFLLKKWVKCENGRCLFFEWRKRKKRGYRFLGLLFRHTENGEEKWGRRNPFRIFIWIRAGSDDARTMPLSVLNSSTMSFLHTQPRFIFQGETRPPPEEKKLGLTHSTSSLEFGGMKWNVWVRIMCHGNNIQDNNRALFSSHFLRG